MHTTAIKKILLSGTALMLLVGCGEQPEPVYDENGICTSIPREKVFIDTNTGNQVIERHTIYTPDVDLKSTVVILTKKVESLEKKAASFKPSIAPASTSSVIQGCGPIAPNKKSESKYKDGKYKAKSKSPVWTCATERGKVLRYVEKNIVLDLKNCGRYGWCDIIGQEGYVQAYRFVRKGK
jgi:hypothetical protein